MESFSLRINSSKKQSMNTEPQSAAEAAFMAFYEKKTPLVEGEFFAGRHWGRAAEAAIQWHKDHLPKEPEKSPWVACNDREPTRLDASPNGKVMVLRHGRWVFNIWSHVVQGEWWMRVPPIPAKADPMREEFEAWASGTFLHNKLSRFMPHDEHGRPTGELGEYVEIETLMAWQAWQAAKKGGGA